MDELSLALAHKWKNGLVPPQMGVLLDDPRRIVAYDTFDRTTASGSGLGTSDSGHEWSSLWGNHRVNPRGVGVSTTTGTSCARLSVVPLPARYTMHALVRQVSGLNGCGLLLAFVDSNNYLYLRTTPTGTPSIRKVVGGTTTTLATGASILRSMRYRYGWVSAEVDTENNVVRGWTEEATLVEYDISLDPDAELFIGSWTPGLWFPASNHYVIRFCVISEEGTSWAT